MGRRLNQSTRNSVSRAAGALLLAVTTGLLAPSAPADFESGLAAFEAGNHGDAFTEFQGPAAAGHAYSQFYTGLAYQKGWGVIAKLEKAATWYERAGE